MPNPITRRHPLVEVEIVTYSGTFTIRNDENEARNSLLSVNTSKSMAAPAGTFTIRLKPLRDAEGLTLYDRLKPMDMVTIRMSPNPGEEPRMIMRGLIDTVRISTDVQGNQVQEFINITGRDFGKLFLIHRAYYFKALENISGFFAIGQYGVKEVNFLSLKNILTEIFTKIFQLSSDLKYTNGQSVSNLVELLIAPTAGFIGDDNGIVLKTGAMPLQTQEGTVWSLLQMYSNAPFVELFVRDDDDTSRLIIRSALLKDFDGKFTHTYSENERDNLFKVDIDGVRISERDIITRDIGRSDAEVKSLFFTVGKDYLLSGVEFKGATVAGQNFFPTGLQQEGAIPTAARENPFLAQLASDLAGVDIYGIRPFEIETNYLAFDRGAKRESFSGSLIDSVTAGKELNKILVGNYKHNVYLESGTITIIGNNQPRIGYYLKVEDNIVPGGEFEFYTEGVSHKFTAFGNWTTTLQVTRGNRWIRRFSGRELEELNKLDLQVTKPPLKLVETEQFGFTAFILT